MSFPKKGELLARIKALLQSIKDTRRPLISLLEQFRGWDDVDFNDNDLIKHFESVGEAILSQGKEDDVIELLQRGSISKKNEIIELMNLPIRKACTVEEMLGVNMDIMDECNNVSLVNGDCGTPSLKQSITAVDYEKNSSIKKILTAIKEKLYDNRDIAPDYFDLVLGASNPSEQKSQFTVSEGQTRITLMLDISTGYEDADIVIDKIKKSTDLRNKIFMANTYYPLDHTKPNNREIIDLTLGIHAISKLRITNRMCGTCHRSLYFLVSSPNVSYCVSPEQGLNETTNGLVIQECFSGKGKCNDVSHIGGHKGGNKEKYIKYKKKYLALKKLNKLN